MSIIYIVTEESKNFMEKDNKVDKKVLDEILVEEQNIIDEWKKSWDADIFVLEGYGGIDKNDENTCFKDWLVTTMDFFEYKVQKNKQSNFRIKRAILVYLCVFAMGVCVFVVLKRETSSIEIIKKYIVQLVTFLFPLYVLAKWLDIKKYQESWARYTRTRSRILSEMVRYIYRVDKYNSDFRKVIFIESILEITNKNINKFHDNMTNKEKEVSPITEAVNFISKKKE